MLTSKGLSLVAKPSTCLRVCCCRGVIILLQMRHLTLFAVASLLLHHASSSSPQSTGIRKKLILTSKQLCEDVHVVVELSKALMDEVPKSDKKYKPALLGDLTTPFELPIFDFYDMDLATRLSKKTGIPPLRIFGTLVQIICRLLQFHIKRLLKLDTFEPLVRNKYDSVE